MLAARTSQEQLPALARVRGVRIGDDIPGIGADLRGIGEKLIRTLLDVQFGSFPVQAVFAGGVGDAVQPPGFVPHAQLLLFRIPPDAAVLRCSYGLNAVDANAFELGLRFQDRVVFVLGCQMERARERGFLDQEVVHEQLAAHVDGEHSRYMFEVRHGHGAVVVRIDGCRRPLLGEPDAVVEQLPAVLRPGRPRRGRTERCFELAWDEQHAPFAGPDALPRLQFLLVHPTHVERVAAERQKALDVSLLKPGDGEIGVEACRSIDPGSRRDDVNQTGGRAGELQIVDAGAQKRTALQGVRQRGNGEVAVGEECCAGLEAGGLARRNGDLCSLPFAERRPRQRTGEVNHPTLRGEDHAPLLQVQPFSRFQSLLVGGADVVVLLVEEVKLRDGGFLKAELQERPGLRISAAVGGGGDDEYDAGAGAGDVGRSNARLEHGAAVKRFRHLVFGSVRAIGEQVLVLDQAGSPAGVIGAGQYGALAGQRGGAVIVRAQVPSPGTGPRRICFGGNQHRCRQQR